MLDGLSAEVKATHARHDASGPTPAEGIAVIAGFFDDAVRHSPEASVALYSLGDPLILAAATAEIVAWLHAEGLLPPGADVLDVGCGIGRVAAALAPRCRSVLGLDVSAGMVGEARRRLADHPNVRISLTSGEDLDAVETAAFDLVLAIDSFPYIVQTGPETALRHVRGAARALRPGGALCILNLSFRCDPAQDRADAIGWAADSGMHMTHDGGRPFRLWDGTAFVLRA
jgi:SAM-dependent methyltransferase